ncbi:T9SS type A sorting domain-containing protein, partial [candidate division KSB1 bacterium]|nr:T9SS type A sorting domain-containing protein [candidate division KSB1 bacterium]
GGSVVVGGDAEIGSCSKGVYLQCPHSNNGRRENDGQGANHVSNQDVNASYTWFTDSEMELGDPVNVPIPSTFFLAQNYPNPFNPRTTIEYRLSESDRVNLSVFNINGQLVRTLVQAQQDPGFYTIDWDGSDENGYLVSSGIYLYKLQVKTGALTKRMLFIR